MSKKNRSSKSRNSDYATAFAAALDEQLAIRSLPQAALARKTGRSASYLNHTLAGRKHISPEWVNVIANALECSAAERERLHRAAALDAGFELDFTKK